MGEPYNAALRMTFRVLLADDHAVVRKGLRMVLGMDPDLEVVGEAEDGEQAVAMAERLRPDLVVMDLLMPHMNGVAATAAIRQALPATQVLALTSALEDDMIVAAVRAGAIGYLLKDARADELCQAVKAAAAGQAQLAPEAAQRLLREVRAPEDRAPGAAVAALSQRETDVLRLLAAGLANKEIAGELSIGEQTVKTHVSSILGKLGVQSRTQAALYAQQHGLVGISN